MFSPMVKLQVAPAERIKYSTKVVNADPSTGELVQTIVPLDNPIDHLPSMGDVEDYYLGAAHVAELSFNGVTSESNVYCFTKAEEQAIALSIYMRRMMNLIKLTSRRGKADVALMHPDTVGMLKEWTGPRSIVLTPPDEAESAGRWQKEGTLVDATLTVWSCRDYPIDRVAIVFVGDNDQDGLITVKEDDGFTVYAPINSFDQYVRAIQLVA